MLDFIHQKSLDDNYIKTVLYKFIIAYISPKSSAWTVMFSRSKLRNLWKKSVYHVWIYLYQMVLYIIDDMGIDTRIMC